MQVRIQQTKHCCNVQPLLTGLDWFVYVFTGNIEPSRGSPSLLQSAARRLLCVLFRQLFSGNIHIRLYYSLGKATKDGIDPFLFFISFSVSEQMVFHRLSCIFYTFTLYHLTQYKTSSLGLTPLLLPPVPTCWPGFVLTPPLAAEPGWFCSRKPKPRKTKQFWLQSFNLPSDQIDLLLVFIWKVPLFSLCFPCVFYSFSSLRIIFTGSRLFFFLLHLNIDCFDLGSGHSTQSQVLHNPQLQFSHRTLRFLDIISLLTYGVNHAVECTQ